MQERKCIVVSWISHTVLQTHQFPVVSAGKDIMMVLLPITAFKAGSNFLSPILPLQRAVYPPHPNLLVLFSKRNQRQKNDFTLSLRFFPPPLLLER